MVQFFPPNGQFPHLHLPHGGLNSVPNASTTENLVITFFEEINQIVIARSQNTFNIFSQTLS